MHGTCNLAWSCGWLSRGLAALLDDALVVRLLVTVVACVVVAVVLCHAMPTVQQYGSMSQSQWRVVVNTVVVPAFRRWALGNGHISLGFVREGGVVLLCSVREGGAGHMAMREGAATGGAWPRLKARSLPLGRAPNCLC